MRKMQIKDAKAIFQDWGDSLTKGYDTMIDVRRTQYPKKGLHNDNYCHALFFTDYLFRHSQHSICMLTGGISNHGFLDMLFNSFSKAVERICENGGKVRIIVLNGPICSKFNQLKEKFKTTLFIEPAQTTSGKPLPHFVICDNNMVRDEEVHVELNDDTPADEVNATVFFNDTTKAAVFQDKFEGYWKSVTASK